MPKPSWRKVWRKVTSLSAASTAASSRRAGRIWTMLFGKASRAQRKRRGGFPPRPDLAASRSLVGVALLEGLAEDVAERRTRIRRTILRDRLLLLGDLHRLDREGRLLGAVEAAHHRIELLADLEPLGTLLVAVAAEIATLD